MANLNKVMLIGRLTRDPETRAFANGGKVAKFGFAVNNRKKNTATGQWEDEPVFVEVSAFNRETGRKLADTVEQYMKKGHLAYLEGHLTLDQWTSQNGEKRSMLKVILDDFQFLQPKADGTMGDGGMRASRPAAPAMSAAPSSGMNGGYDEPAPALAPSSAGGGDEEIPF
jgi:single-strand DNA-binding protein